MLLRVAGWRALSAHSDPFQTTIKKTSRLVIAARLLAGSGMGPKTFFIVPTRVAVDTQKTVFSVKIRPGRVYQKYRGNPCHYCFLTL